MVSFSNPWVVKKIKKDSNNQVQPVLLSLMCEKRKEEVTDELVKFIYQLSVEDVKVVVGTLKKPIHFVKENREK